MSKMSESSEFSKKTKSGTWIKSVLVSTFLLLVLGGVAPYVAAHQVASGDWHHSMGGMHGFGPMTGGWVNSLLWFGTFALLFWLLFQLIKERGATQKTEENTYRFSEEDKYDR